MDKRIIGVIGLGGLGALLYYAMRGRAIAPAPFPTGCKEGSTKCIGTNLYMCKNGQWILYEINSTKCGYKPITPQCNEGQTKCVGYNLYVCQNGTWVLKEQNSVQCGYKPPAPAPSNKIIVTINNPTPYYVGIEIDNKPSKVVHSGTVSFTFNDTGQHLFRFFLLRTTNTPYGINVSSSLKYLIKQEFLDVGKSYAFTVPKITVGIDVVPWEVVEFLPLDVIIGGKSYGNNTNINANLYPGVYTLSVKLTHMDYVAYYNYSGTRIENTVLASTKINPFPGEINYYKINAVKDNTGAIWTSAIIANSKGEIQRGNIKITLGSFNVQFNNASPRIDSIDIINIPAGTYPFSIYLNSNLVHTENVTVKSGKTIYYVNKVWSL